LVVEIVVNKKGQVTIPIKIRKKLKMTQGMRLWVLEKDEGIMLTPKKTIWDMIGAFPVDPATKVKMDKQLYDYRHEEDDDLDLPPSHPVEQQADGSSHKLGKEDFLPSGEATFGAVEDK
jgi:AbrB family looped-hinge helix DNA binding protein